MLSYRSSSKSTRNLLLVLVKVCLFNVFLSALKAMLMNFLCSLTLAYCSAVLMMSSTSSLVILSVLLR